MKTYIVSNIHGVVSLTVHPPGRPISPVASLGVARHSRTFGTGNTPGAYQLALAILLDYFGNATPAAFLTEHFSQTVISVLPASGFQIASPMLETWLNREHPTFAGKV